MKRISTVLAVISLCSLALSAPGHAQISTNEVNAFNAAVDSGDARSVQRAAKSLLADVRKNPGDADSAVLSYEAGWVLCRIGDCASAVPAGEFLAGHPISDPTTHPIKADRDLLLAYANWIVKRNTNTRKALDAALDNMDGVEPSLLSVKAFTDRYRIDQIGSDRNLIKESARAAREHMEPIGDFVPDQLAVANYVEAVAAWGGSVRSTDQMRMEHAIWQFQILMQDENYKNAEGVADLRWQAEAWRGAMRSYAFAKRFGQSPNKRVAGTFPGMSPEQQQEVAALYLPKLQAARAKTAGENAGQLPRCVGTFNEQPARAPRGRDQELGYIGSVIVGMDVEAGKLVNVRVLSAVPDDKYAKFAVEAFKDLSWKRAEEQPVENCTDSFKDLTFPFTFSFQG